MSVSFWPVSDDSTLKFMAMIYSLVEKEGMEFYKAMAQAKRLFIKGGFGDGYSLPYFWAPFIYYGK